MFRRATTAIIICFVLGALFLGCGSSSDDSGSAPEVTTPSKEFTGKGNNSPASFGYVASDEEREAASEVLEENLQARGTGDWATQCATINADQESRAGIYAPQKGCAAGLAVEVKRFKVSKSSLANTMSGPISVLRVQGNYGHALYHGKKGQDYAMLMQREDGEWKVAWLKEVEVP